MKILAFAASNKKQSINKALIRYVGNQLQTSHFETLDINDFDMPIYSEDLEALHGIPDAAKRFLAKLGKADALIISLAEHNGIYTAAFKNLLDWASRVDRNIFQNKPVLLLATSPGAGGASSVLAFAENSLPFFGGVVAAAFSLPSFYDNFDLQNNKISHQDFDAKLKRLIADLEG